MQSQLSRMFRYYTFSNSRLKRVNAAYNRYRNNIQRSLGYSDRGRGVGALNSANMTFSNPRYQSIGAINSERVSRRTYMGLNAG